MTSEWLKARILWLKLLEAQLGYGQLASLHCSDWTQGRPHIWSEGAR